MATDPTIPPPNDDTRRIFAEQVDRGNGLADLQALRLIGDDTAVGAHLKFPNLDGYGVSLTAADPAPLSIPVLTQSFVAGSFHDHTGVSAATYAAGKQIGEASTFTLLGAPFPAIQLYLRGLALQVLDPDGVLDDTTTLWACPDFGVTDGGDGSTFELNAPFNALARAFGVIKIGAMGAGRSLVFEPASSFSLSAGTKMWLQAGASSTLSGADLSVAWSGEIAGYSA